ncbi:MAG TPA: hypothetical protein VM260_10270 [Pirellula sp.]|nr:hypothetical protein [Pirellula sp.]
MKKIQDSEFRERFARMADQAVITRLELASLLATTDGAISQMAFRGELPITAFPTKRRSCWFVRDVRAWLDNIATQRALEPTSEGPPHPTLALQRIGRPRLAVDTRL